MPVRFITAFATMVLVGIGSFMYRSWLQLLGEEAPDFVRKYSIPRTPVDLRARPGAGFYSIVFRRYREVASERVRRKGDLLFVMLVVGVICAILTAVLPDTVWLG